VGGAQTSQWRITWKKLLQNVLIIYRIGGYRAVLMFTFGFFASAIRGRMDLRIVLKRVTVKIFVTGWNYNMATNSVADNFRDSFHNFMFYRNKEIL
jgi:hypothetical protein